MVENSHVVIMFWLQQAFDQAFLFFQLWAHNLSFWTFHRCSVQHLLPTLSFRHAFVKFAELIIWKLLNSLWLIITTLTSKTYAVWLFIRNFFNLLILNRISISDFQITSFSYFIMSSPSCVLGPFFKEHFLVKNIGVLRPNINNILLMVINLRWTLENFFVFTLHF